jgi:hypothetical protein
MAELGPLVRVRSVIPLKNFVVRLDFENGRRNDIDLEPFLHGPIFDPIRRDPAMFKSVTVRDNTIGWDNGADIDPDVLYYDLKPSWMEDQAAHS